MTELERADADHLVMGAEILPIGKQLDGGALGILEGQRLRRSGQWIRADIAPDPFPRKMAADPVEIGMGCDLE
jgi:hypothetical protein